MAHKHKRAKSALFSKDEAKLIARINALIQSYDCVVTALGSQSVGVQGDARSYGHAICIRFPIDVTADRINEVSSLVTNRVREITRVLRDV